MNEDPLKDATFVPSNMSLAAVIDHMGSDVSMQRGRPYDGQPHTTDGKRGAEFIRNMTFRDLRDCFIRGFISSHMKYKNGSLETIQPNQTLIDECEKGQNAAICQNDVYTLVGDTDPIAVWQNMACEIEKVMKIYPNIDKKDWKALL